MPEGNSFKQIPVPADGLGSGPVCGDCGEPEEISEVQVLDGGCWSMVMSRLASA